MICSYKNRLTMTPGPRYPKIKVQDFNSQQKDETTSKADSFRGSRPKSKSQELECLP